MTFTEIKKKKCILFVFHFSAQFQQPISVTDFRHTVLATGDVLLEWNLRKLACCSLFFFFVLLLYYAA